MNLRNCETSATKYRSLTESKCPNPLGPGSRPSASTSEVIPRPRNTAACNRTARRKRSSTFSRCVCRAGVLALIPFAFAVASTRACGPFFPNNLLTSGDQAVLAAPLADFAVELSRLKLPASRFQFVAATDTYAEHTFDAEMADLAAALKEAKFSPADSALIVEAHRVNRRKLGDYLAAHAEWESQSMQEARDNPPANPATPPVFPVFTAPPGLPEEFADYFAGAAALGQPGESNSCRTAWERLLARPAGERKYKSTWAAFMLGRTLAKSDADKAVEYFKQTRDLARHGFRDSLGLATAALGLEAQIELGRKHFKRALELYLEQYTAGDESAINSLRLTAEQALSEGGDQLAALAAIPNTRAVITAWLICDQHPYNESHRNTIANQVTRAWLEAVEATGGQDLEAAERLALAAYQAGEFEVAQRWINRARSNPVAQWLQAKLFLRAGKVAPAATLLAKLADQLPLAAGNERTNSTEFAGRLHMGANSFTMGEDTARRQLHGELGVLRLSRREFTQALDALLRAGYWPDAAYVAERVLTTDELKEYVDREWQADEAASESPTGEDAESETASPDTRREDIRYLLGRRLLRELRAKEAREYFPAKWQSDFDELVRALDAGWDEKSPAEQRAKALFEAAVIARANGLELLGSELAPDWHIHGGDFEEGVTWEARATNNLAAKVNVASAEEIHRAAQHRTDPNVRFHYRYQAAFLGWEAAKLMPDNSDETARVLCRAGAWLKTIDPKTADMFYKALVRRCRHTVIGAQADRMRWFPVLDAAGNPKPYRSRLEHLTPPESRDGSAGSLPGTFPEAVDGETTLIAYPLPGQSYFIHQGDSIGAIANAVSRLGQALTPKAILEANPQLDPARLKVGQKILIPASEAGGEADPANAVPEREN